MEALELVLETMTKPCKGCGKPVLFLKDMHTGKWQILDRTAPVWGASRESDGPITCYRLQGAMVSHFSTCPKADEF